MMQIYSEFSNHKHSLLNVMNRFIAAATNMDETIMVPSMLRDVPLEEQDSLVLVVNNSSSIEPSYPGKQKDMYEHYLLVKSLKNDMEWGLLREMGGGPSFLEMAVKQEEEPKEVGVVPCEETLDLESEFHYHLHGLFGILSKLTLQADHLTNRYKREIGGGNFMR